MGRAPGARGGRGNEGEREEARYSSYVRDRTTEEEPQSVTILLQASVNGLHQGKTVFHQTGVSSRCSFSLPSRPVSPVLFILAPFSSSLFFLLLFALPPTRPPRRSSGAVGKTGTSTSAEEETVWRDPSPRRRRGREKKKERKRMREGGSTLLISEWPSRAATVVALPHWRTRIDRSRVPTP